MCSRAWRKLASTRGWGSGETLDSQGSRRGARRAGETLRSGGNTWESARRKGLGVIWRRRELRTEGCLNTGRNCLLWRKLPRPGSIWNE